MSRALRLIMAKYLTPAAGGAEYAAAIEDLSVTFAAVKPTRNFKRLFCVAWLDGAETTLSVPDGYPAHRAARDLDDWHKAGSK